MDAPRRPLVYRYVVRASWVVGSLYVLWIAVFFARWGAAIPRFFLHVARFGMVFNIAATVVLAVLWRMRRRLGLRPAPRVPGEPAIAVADLDAAEASTLGVLEGTAEFIRHMNSAPTIDAIALVHEVVRSGFLAGASDIHLTPHRDALRVVYRIDGVLHEVAVLDVRHAAFIVNRIKVMAKLSIHIKAKPQDGRIQFDREEFQARVSTLPTNHGENVVIRLAVNDERRYCLERAGFSDADLMLYQTLLIRDHGVIYLTGPSGSGKTTTMYASMMHIRDTGGYKVNLVTLEDPIEVDLRGIAQTQIDPAVGLTFAAGLRSILRQDPDVIMVGEIRDEETAQTAMRAGLTGHLLLTSVHADSTVGVFSRLKQLKVDPFQLASASIAVVNQRLAIRNCPGCTAEIHLSDLQKKQLALLCIDSSGPFFEGEGCHRCRGSGRLGRVPLVELLCLTDSLRDQLLAHTPAHKLVEAAVKEGSRTLSMQALEHANRGDLPADEVIRVLSL